MRNIDWERGGRMDIKGIAESYNIPLHRLRDYEAAGLLQKQAQGEYKMSDIDRLGLLEMLVKVGFAIGEIKCYVALDQGEESQRRRVQLLRDKRRKILSDIHGKQTLLDHIDYFIWNIEKKKNRKKSSKLGSTI